MEIHLPADVLEEIFSYLDGFSLLQAAQVSKSWSEAADRGFLWRRLCLRKWSLGKHQCPDMSHHLGTDTWKQFFLQRTRQERCMERAKSEDFIYRGFWGDIAGDFTSVKYLSGSGFTMDGKGKPIICTVTKDRTLSTWDVQEGIKIWSSPVQNTIINLDTLPELQLAITLDMQRTIKVWNCRDRDSLAARNMHQGCYALKAFLIKNGPFLLVGDFTGHIYMFMLPELTYISTVKALHYGVHLLQCSPENKWIFLSNMHPSDFPKVFLTECLLCSSEDCSHLEICLPIQSCDRGCWMPRRENRIILMYRKESYRFTGFITLDIGVKTIGGKATVRAQTIANFQLPSYMITSMMMGVGEGNVIVIGSGQRIFLFTIYGVQLYQFEDHKTNIGNLWTGPLHVLSSSLDGSLHVYMWEEGGCHLRSCCHLEYMERSLTFPSFIYNTTCDNVSIVRVVTKSQAVNLLEMFTLNMSTHEN